MRLDRIGKIRAEYPTNLAPIAEETVGVDTPPSLEISRFGAILDLVEVT